MKQYSKEFESSLNERERLGLAWCRLNCLEWDDYIGEKPVEFDALPIYVKLSIFPFTGKKESKFNVTYPIMRCIESILGEAETDWYWWRFALERTDREAWIKQYIQRHTV